MKHQIDLHGLSIRKAVTKAELFLIEASFDKNMHVEIITGKSGNMQEHIIKEVLEPYKFEYYIPHDNVGMLIVTQNEL
jgi:DNA-nicking Smr family endonuclease|tara:strand:+ start:110 stop:343 length:234 start_codon:yes stop_codon:yes gene_type:complete